MTAEKTWAEIEALKRQLNRDTIARRQTLKSTKEDRYLWTLGNSESRLTVLVDAKGQPIEIK